MGTFKAVTSNMHRHVVGRRGHNHDHAHKLYSEHKKTREDKKMISVELTDIQKIGLGLVLFGMALLFLGIMFFFDTGLLAIGNILFIAGILFIIGPQRTASFFFQSHKLKGTAFFAGGIFIVLIGWPIIGMIIESCGAFMLFKGLLPYATLFLRRLPVIGHILNLPGIKSVVNLASDDSNSPA